jgi:hypothetical protein
VVVAVSTYRYLAADLASPGTPIAELPFGDVSWGRMLNGAGEFSAKVKLPMMATPEDNLLCGLYIEATDRATKCVYVIRDGVPLGCYIIWTQSYDAAIQTITVGGAEMFSYSRRRIVEDTSGDLNAPLVFTTARPIDIAVALLTKVNEIGLTFDIVGAGTGGTTIDKTYRGTDNRLLADEILELAALDDGGFDFRTDVRLTASGAIEPVWIARPFLGGTTEIVAKYETNVATLGLTRRGDLRANDAIVFGPTQAGDSSTRAYKRHSTGEWGPTMSVVEAHSNEAEPDAVLDTRAAGLLAAFKDHEVLDVTVAASSIDAQLGTFHPGDVMRLTIPQGIDPFFGDGLDTTRRLLRYQVDVPDEGGGAEAITLSLGDS